VACTLVYRSYAKLNLYLDVLQRRRDGYHDIETIFQTVDLADELRLVERPSGISLTCSSPELETGELNLAYRAAQVLLERTGAHRGVAIGLEKTIPIAAGLAGGSGNAAAALVGLNVLWELRLSGEDIAQLALELGSDVPYCTLGGTMGATRRGEDLFALPALPNMWFVLVHPPIPVSAARVYNSPLLARSTSQRVAGRTARFRRALRSLREGDLGAVVFNGMEAPVFAAHPVLAVIKQQLLDAGCIAAAMSGSGPTLFGIAPNQRTATTIAARITDYPTSVVQCVPRGVERMQ
jgi:4-diphosphocytidyl-2-C-methyl-D-erythritol kinase